MPAGDQFRRYTRKSRTSAGDQNRLRQTVERHDTIIPSGGHGSVSQRMAGIPYDLQSDTAFGLWARLTVNHADGTYSWQQIQAPDESSAYADLSDGLNGTYDGDGAGAAREVNGNASLHAHATTGLIVLLELADAGAFYEFDAFASPLTTKGDLYTYDTADARLPVGTDGQILESRSSETTGLKWIPPPSINTGYTTTATAGATTTLTATSTGVQYFTGTLAQTVVMPVVSTLTLGQFWLIVNLSTTSITIQSSGGNTILTLLPGLQATFTTISLVGTTAASWNAQLTGSSFISWAGPTSGHTYTLPDAATTVPIISQLLTFLGPTAARTYTLPDSAQTLAGLNVAQSWLQAQTYLNSSGLRILDTNASNYLGFVV
ncbi:MAG: hypothetical protein RLZZ373_323, partial [Pseudomonadota bacterium]